MQDHEALGVSSHYVLGCIYVYTYSEVCHTTVKIQNYFMKA